MFHKASAHDAGLIMPVVVIIVLITGYQGREATLTVSLLDGHLNHTMAKGIVEVLPTCSDIAQHMVIFCIFLHRNVYISPQ